MSDSIDTSEDMARPYTPENRADGEALELNPIASAIRLLREAAHEYAVAVTIDGQPDWQHEPETKEAHDELLRVANALEQQAGADGLTSAERSTLVAVLDVVRCADRALDDSEEMEGDDGERCHSVHGQDFDDLDEALSALSDLPDEDPDYTLGPAGKARWALRRLLNEWPLGRSNPTLITPSNAALDVMAERVRQIRVEGWMARHDDGHRHGELAVAAACYAIADVLQDRTMAPGMWPWTVDWWKPSDNRRNLVKAGALILAEIERLDRAAAASRHASNEAST